jgi:hypothetical protein
MGESHEFGPLRCIEVQGHMQGNTAVEAKSE